MTPANFQRLLQTILTEELETSWIQVYIDNIIIFTHTKKKHYAIIKRVLNKHTSRNVIVNFEKSFSSLNHWNTSAKSLTKMDFSHKENVDKLVNEIQNPTTKNDLEKVLGTLQYHSKFISNFSNQGKKNDLPTG